VRKGVNAGIDMFMQPQNFEQFESTLTDEVDAGRVSMSRIDDAVQRILTMATSTSRAPTPTTSATRPVAGR
jgi:beta-glucosidase